MYDWLSLQSLPIICLVWPTRLVVLAMGEVLSFGFDLACPFPVTEGAARHACIVAIKDNKMGSIPT